MHFDSILEMTPFLYMFRLSLKWLGRVAALDADEQYWNTKKQSAWKTQQYIHFKYALSRSFHVTCMEDCSPQQPAGVYKEKIHITSSSANKYCLATEEPAGAADL